MPSIIETIQTGIMYACIAFLGVMLASIALYKGNNIFLSFWRKTRSFPLVLLFVAGIIYGGSKSSVNKNKTSTDESIDLIDIGLNVSNVVSEVEGVVTTNFYSATLTITVTDESDPPYPLWIRDNNYQSWTNVNTLATWETANPVLDQSQSTTGTNVYVWVSYDWDESEGKQWNYTQWYIGTDLPAVQVDVTDTDYIVLDEFNMTSKKVRIKFHLKSDFTYPEGSVIEVQRKTNNGRWEVVDELEAVQNGVYTWNGFCVDKRTVWRLHMAVTVEEEEE